MLKVRGGFHSPFMNTAAQAFRQELEEVSLQQSRIRLYADLTAEPYDGKAAELLSSQICSPVQWEKLIRNMIADGVDTFIEIGPGKTLTNLIRRIDPAVKAVTIYEYLAEGKAC